jgi:hypothetical protein
MRDIDTKDYKKTGALLLKGLFGRHEVEAIRQDAKGIFARQLLRNGLIDSTAIPEPQFNQALYRYFKLNLTEFTNCGKQAQHLVSLHRLSLDERVVSVLTELDLSVPNISTRPVLFFNSPHLATEEVYWRVFAHQDWRSMQGSLDSVVVWVPLTDVDAALGALEIVPGSHQLGLLTEEVVNGFGKVNQFADDAFVSLPVSQGDALFFSSFLVHRSGTNATESIRWSCHFRYNNLAEKTFIERGYPHAYIYRPKEELLTPGFPDKDQVKERFL